MDAQQFLPQVPGYVKFRVLVIGRANAGKTTILQRVCDTTESPVINKHDQSGNREEVRSQILATHSISSSSQVQLKPSMEVSQAHSVLGRDG
jgi:GTPase SAR1 family protein